MFSAKMRYASMFMLDLAKSFTNDCSGNSKVTKISDTSCANLAPKSYYEEVICNLRRENLITSVKGRGGGYTLARSPFEITVADIARAVCGRVKMQKCSHSIYCKLHECGSNTGNCDVSDLFEKVDAYIDGYMENISLGSLLKNVKGRTWIRADCNAAMPSLNAAKAALLSALDSVNPSSPGSLGQFAKSLIEQARRKILNTFNGKNYYAVFTNSGSAANNLVTNGLPNFVNIISPIEHPSIINALPNAIKIKVLDSGIVDLDSLCTALKDVTDSNVLVSIMTANNETGVIQPVHDISEICKKNGALFHTDAVQVCGKIPLDLDGIGADFVTVSAHKSGSVSGTGVTFIKRGLTLKPMIYGGSDQEYGLFAGTENTGSIHAFGVVAENIPKLTERMAEIALLRDYMECSIKRLGDDVIIIGESAARLPNTSLVCVRGIETARQIAIFDAHEIGVGSGSACSYGKSEYSHVLRAMGIENSIAKCAIRVSLGYNISQIDIDRIIECWREIYSKERQ